MSSGSSSPSRVVVHFRLAGGGDRAYSVVAPSAATWDALLPKAASKLSIDAADVTKIVKVRTASESGLSIAVSTDVYEVKHGDWFEISVPAPNVEAEQQEGNEDRTGDEQLQEQEQDQDQEGRHEEQEEEGQDKGGQEQEEVELSEEAAAIAFAEKFGIERENVNLVPPKQDEKLEKFDDSVVQSMRAVVGEDVDEPTLTHFLSQAKGDLERAIDRFFTAGGQVPQQSSSAPAAPPSKAETGAQTQKKKTKGGGGAEEEEPLDEDELQQILNAMGEDFQLRLAMKRSSQEEVAEQWRAEQKIKFKQQMKTKEEKKKAKKKKRDKQQQQQQAAKDGEGDDEDDNAFLDMMIQQAKDRAEGGGEGGDGGGEGEGEGEGESEAAGLGGAGDGAGAGAGAGKKKKKKKKKKKNQQQ